MLNGLVCWARISRLILATFWGLSPPANVIDASGMRSWMALAIFAEISTLMGICVACRQVYDEPAGGLLVQPALLCDSFGVAKQFFDGRSCDLQNDDGVGVTFGKLFYGRDRCPGHIFRSVDLDSVAIWSACFEGLLE